MHAPKFPAVLPMGVQISSLSQGLLGSQGSSEADAGSEIDFDPVPRRRNRRSGWTDERQRAFIAALARCGSVRAACRQVGLSACGVYKLLDMDGSEGFALAWDQAMDIGAARLKADALQRALNGAFVPIYRKGRLVRVEYRRCDRLAISMLGGRDRNVADYGGAVRRAQHKRDLRDHAAAKAAVERERVEFWEQYDTELKAMLERGRAARQPSVRTL
jgi:hypothetical protein